VTPLVDKVLAVDAGLETAGIPHAFGGAIALAYCIEEARATQDIDVNVFVAPSEAPRVFDALPVGTKVRAADRRVAERDGQVRVWWERTPVDIFFAYHELHEQAGRRCRRVSFGPGTIPVLDCTHLTVFKAFFARTRDWADIETMASAGPVDEGEATGWLRDLVGPDSDTYTRLVETFRAPPPDDRPFPRLPGR
jgi:hypothetical protein